MSKNLKPPTFHLGITMAGAVSAGAYTAGFMDYILEVLAVWEKAKDKNRNAKNDKEYDSRIPMHNVIIDAIGGASAGGMVSMITALSFYYKDMKPVKKKSYTKTGNILYDSWVFLDDDLNDDINSSNQNNRTTFEKMLDTNDIDNVSGTPALLNSTPIDKIAERAFNTIPKNTSISDFPPYISKDLRVLLTLTSLKPVDYVVNFSRIKSAFMDTTPGHRISNHEIIAHFKLNFDAENDKELYLPFKPHEKESKDFLIKATKATGAFPIGLEPRHFDEEFSTKYVNTSLARKLAITQNMDIRFDSQGKDFKFTGVDGGTINNEPFDEVIRCLVSNHGKQKPEEPKYGTILIDPFPNFENKDKKDIPNYQRNIFEVIGKLIPTILNQARNKRNDTYGFGFFKLLAFPIKWEKQGVLKEHPPLATGGLGGFGGFLGIEFRMHDFFLGRDNARNFLRGFLFLEYDSKKPSYLFKDITPEAVKVFDRKYTSPETGKEKIYLPIIPDVNSLLDDDNGNPYAYTVDEFPKLDINYLNKLKKPIKGRVKKILKTEIKLRLKGNFLLRNAIKLVLGVISKKITNKVYDSILEDFKNRKMI